MAITATSHARRLREGEVLRQGFFEPDESHREKPAPPFAVHYLNASALPNWLPQSGNILGAIAYGAPTSNLLPANCPSATAPLAPTAAEPAFEIWTTPAPVQPLHAGTVSGAFNNQIAFGIATLNEQDGLEAATERAYTDIFDFLEASGNKVPIRFWNYPLAINDEDNGMERYRRFNIGRHRAFSARLHQNLPPAASAVGGHEGQSLIYFLAAPNAATPVENPRQVSAYNYPQIYGPRSPSFSRASIYTQNNASCLFVSGTASIVGHETKHEGDLPNQIAETAENLRAIINAAEKSTTPLTGKWAIKIYLTNPSAQPMVAKAVNAIFGATSQQLYLHGDICRKELLVEIEAFKDFFL
jgi:chorismate lyase/3-hydroxybenzoate synthase